ncbi:MAG: FecR domain-containing protein [Burkholderiaceae bacterium]
MLTKQFRVAQLLPVILGVMVVCHSSTVWSQNAGEVEFSRGVGFAQTPGQLPRTLGKGLPLKEGDRLTTAEGASAIIKLQDGTRMTVRPNSEIVLQQYQFKENATDNSMVLGLLRGGLRAVTGLISKSSPNSARIQTNTATIGIRGTDFDARICAKDCGQESAQIKQNSRPNSIQASARVLSVQGGQMSAMDSTGQKRVLVDGGSVYPGDLLETSSNTRAVLAFRDDSRVTLAATTRFRVDNFVYDEKNPNEGRFLVSLLRGSVRALTGLIAKANNRNVGFSTSTATIGIRGTGLDLVCTGACAVEPVAFDDSAPSDPFLQKVQLQNPGADSGLTVFAWLGSITVQSGQTALQVLQAGQGLVITPTGIRAVTVPPNINVQRPDTVTVPANTFASQDVADTQEGLFVVVRDGHISVASAGEVLNLGRGEAGVVGVNGTVARPSIVPKFIEFDRVVLPTVNNPAAASVINETRTRNANQCS